MTIVTGYDVEGCNLDRAPSGAQLAGYVTGGDGIAWAEADWEAHTHAVRIDQAPALPAVDLTADAYDCEKGAIAFADIGSQVKAALRNYQARVRAGQRSPLAYASQSTLTAVCNSLAAAGVTSGAGLWVAAWGIGQAAAEAMITGASGPYPVRAVQLLSGPYYDTNLFDADWLASGTVAAPPAPAYEQVPGAPETHPVNIVVSPDPKTTVSWTQVGGSTGYTVELELGGKLTTASVGQTHAVFDNLAAGAWTARVCAVNAKGAGPWSPWTGFKVGG